MMTNNAPFEVLNTIRGQALALAKQGLTYATQSAGIKNIAYIVNGINYYCDAQDIKEVSTCDNLMVMPQTKNWMRGLVNSKGVLYSVTDLSLFAGYGRTTQAQRGHLLLLNEAGQQSALLVNRVIGFRYFEGAKELVNLDDKQELLDGLSSYVDKGFYADGQDWFRLNVSSLLSSERFREVQ
ncbi:MAG: chemotaxis signal transduction protein [Arenicella sp.]|jgi:chemotaxis signal transduction protein